MLEYKCEKCGLYGDGLPPFTSCPNCQNEISIAVNYETGYTSTYITKDGRITHGYEQGNYRFTTITQIKNAIESYIKSFAFSDAEIYLSPAAAEFMEKYDKKYAECFKISKDLKDFDVKVERR